MVRRVVSKIRVAAIITARRPLRGNERAEFIEQEAITNSDAEIDQETGTAMAPWRRRGLLHVDLNIGIPIIVHGRRGETVMFPVPRSARADGDHRLAARLRPRHYRPAARRTDGKHIPGSGGAIAPLILDCGRREGIDEGSWLNEASARREVVERGGTRGGLAGVFVHDDSEACSGEVQASRSGPSREVGPDQSIRRSRHVHLVARRPVTYA